MRIGRPKRGTPFATRSTRDDPKWPRATRRPRIVSAITPRGRFQGSVAAALFASLYVLCFTGGAATASSNASKPILQVGIPTVGIPNFNPTSGDGAWPYTSDGLVHALSNGKFGPGLALAWHLGDGNRVLEFTLRKNARFQDGTPVTAAAIKTWIDYFVKAKGPGTTPLGAVKSVTTSGKWRIRITMAQPSPDILINFSQVGAVGDVQSPAAVAKPALFAKRPEGTGPYLIDVSAAVLGATYTLLPNPYYYNKSDQHWRKVVFRVIADPSSMLEAMQTGQVDVASGDYSTLAEAARHFKVIAKKSTDPLIILDVSGQESKPLGNVRVREALNYAINRKQIAKALFGKYGSPTASMVTYNGFMPKLAASSYPYNPAKARALLAAAGYPNGFTLNNVLTTGSWNGASAGTDLMQAIAQNLAAVGVTLNLVSTANISQWFSALGSNPPPMFEFPAGIDFMTTYYNFFIKSGGFANHIPGASGPGWSDPTLTSLFSAGLSSAHPGTYWRQMTIRTVQQAYCIPSVITDSFLYVNTKKVRGVELPFGDEDTNYTDWLPAR